MQVRDKKEYMGGPSGGKMGAPGHCLPSPPPKKKSRTGPEEENE